MANKFTLIKFSLFLILFLVIPPKIVAADLKAEIVNLGYELAEGYTCNPNGNDTYTVSLYSKTHLSNANCANFEPGELCLIASDTNTHYYRYPESICQSKDRGIRFKIPAELQNQQDHLSPSLVINSQIIGNPLTYNSHNLYLQEKIGADIFDRVLTNHNFVSPDAARDYDHFIYNHLFAANYSGSDAAKINQSISANLSAITGIDTQLPREKYQVGSGVALNGDGSPSYIFLQGGDQSFGIYYNSLANKVPNSGTFVDYKYKNQPNVFRNNPNITVSGKIRQPIKYLDNLTSSDDNVVFYYYVLILKDTTTNIPIWYSADIYQSREPARFPFHDFAVAFDPTGPVTHTKIIPNALYLTPCPNSSFATSNAFPDEKLYCFTLSREQFTSILKYLNATNFANKPANWHVSENPADYTLSDFIINIEGWGIGDQVQSRIGLSFRDLKVTTAPPATCSGVDPSTNLHVNASQQYLDVFAYDVQNAVNVNFPTWSTINGQDDIKWYAGTNLGNGTWKARINLSDHNSFGEFNVHTYMNNNNTLCGKTTFTRSESVSTQPGDLNQDDRVDHYDYNLLIAGYGTTYNYSDYTKVVTNYGK